MAKEKAASSKTAKAKAAELLAQIGNQPSPTDDETRRTRLKTLIKLGKERGFLTYAEVNDHLPDDVVDDQYEGSVGGHGWFRPGGCRKAPQALPGAWSCGK